MSLAFEARLELFAVMATAWPSVRHHNGLLKHGTLYRLESIWF
jgi:hypothetical protein